MSDFTDRPTVMAYLAQLRFSEQTADHLLDRAVIYAPRPASLRVPADDSIIMTEITWSAGQWHVSNRKL